MWLKEITINGFKSFADQTRLKFHRGITGIVGPNGCGKSNISDSFRWVLGEQSAKSLRGGKMPDVIFAGTSSRRPLNRAAVTLTLGDVAGSLPIDYEELSIGRELHRSGESEYSINGNEVRLKDINSLLMDSGIGKDAFAIFEQGKIDAIIQRSPLERRYIFEEAAGILRLRTRIREAMKKLEVVDGDRVRILDIYREIEERIEVLVKQSEKASHYKDQKNLLESLEKRLFVVKWDLLTHKEQEGSSKQQENESKGTLYKEELQVLVDSLKALRQEMAETEAGAKAQREELFIARNEKEIGQRERKNLEERLHEIAQKETQWNQEIQEISSKRQERGGEAKGLEHRRILLQKEVSKFQAELKESRDSLHQKESELAALRDTQQQAQQALMRLVQAEHLVESEIRQNAIRLESQVERKERIVQRQAQLLSQMKELHTQAVEKKEKVDAFSLEIDRQKRALNLQEKEIQELTDRVTEEQKKLDQFNRELTEIRARHQVLVRLREEMEGFSAGSKKLLQETKNVKSVLYGKIRGLYEYLQPDSENETSIAMAMRPYAQTLVVETEEHLNDVIQYSQRHGLKDFSLFCLEHISQQEKGKKEKLLVRLSTHVLENPTSEHFLYKSFTTKTLKEGLEILQEQKNVTVWTEEGVLIDPNGVLFCFPQGEQNTFLRQAELNSLATKLKKIEAKKIESEKSVWALQAERGQKQAERIELDKAIRREEMKFVELNFSFQRIQADLQKGSLEETQFVTEIVKLEKEVEGFRQQSETLQQRQQEAKIQRDDAQQQAVALQTSLQQLQIVFAEQQKCVREKELEFHRITEEERKLNHTLNVIEVQDVEGGQQEKKLFYEIATAQEKRLEWQTRLKELELNFPVLEERLKAQEMALKDVDNKMLGYKSSLDKLEASIETARQQLIKQEQLLHQIGLHQAQALASRQALEEELLHRYGLSIPEAREASEGLDQTAEKLDKKIRAIRQDLELSGDINMASIDECKEYQERHDRMTEQLKDLDLAKSELMQIIGQLEGESRTLFKDTFEQIAANFKKNFEILFTGGEADLQFTDSDDVLEAGIEIVAKPPGKQMRSMMLLSGGEKCLTAMALLFAIFEVKPSPFCILDEIDAPLDDTNVDRFLNVVRQFTDRCQFIIITHNKRTMAICDILYGVSMEERGVSKLLSIEFSNSPKESVEV